MLATLYKETYSYYINKYSEKVIARNKFYGQVLSGRNL